MGRGSTKGNENVYFVARKRAAMYNERLYSREGAAELLGISVSTLADYELGNTKVPRTEEKRRRHWQKEERLSGLPRASWHRLPVVCCRGITRLPRKARYRLSPLRQQRHSITDSYGRTILLVHRPRSIELF